MKTKIALTIAVIATVLTVLSSNAILERQRNIYADFTSSHSVMAQLDFWSTFKWLFFSGRYGTVLPDDSGAHGVCGIEG